MVEDWSGAGFRTKQLLNAGQPAVSQVVNSLNNQSCLGPTFHSATSHTPRRLPSPAAEKRDRGPTPPMRPQPSALPKEQHTIPHINHALWPYHPSDEIEGLVVWCGVDVELVWWLRRCICVVWALPLGRSR